MSDVHRHPTTNFDHSKLFANLAEAEADDVEVVRVFVQIYMDAFPVLSSRKNASSEAIYVSFGNLSQEELQHLDNYFCLGQFPKGVDRHECFKGWLSEFCVLQDGFRVTFPSGKTVLSVVVSASASLTCLKPRHRLVLCNKALTIPTATRTSIRTVSTI